MLRPRSLVPRTALALALIASPLLAGTVDVRQDGLGDATSVQEGIDLAQPGDVVLVHPGVYAEVIVIDKQLEVRSLEGPRATILDGAGLASPVVTLQGPLTSATLFRGFGVRNGLGVGVDAGGIRVVFSSPRVEGNVVQANQSHGMSARGAGTPLFTGNLVQGNSGSGHLNWSSTSTLLRNRFVANAQHGVTLFNSPPARVAGNLIADNDLNGIEGIVPTTQSPVWIENNTIVGNSNGVRVNTLHMQLILRRNLIADNAAFGIECTSFSGIGPVTEENDLWNNAAGDYAGPVFPTDDLALDPLFCPGPGPKDELNANSPCLLGPGALIGAFGAGC